MMLDDAYWLPIVFIGLMGLSILLYAILDGYDLGVGILLPAHEEHHRDTMIASIGPFWDANETWLVLGIGLLLIAFPKAHGVILYHLYLPTTIMLVGLILRGVAFDFRAKAPPQDKRLWDRFFKLGSLMATLSQGYMLGLFVMGFDKSWMAQCFAVLSAICVTAAYSFMGAAWLVMKSEGELQARAAGWARRCLWLTAVGLIAVSLVNPLVNAAAFAKWFGSVWSLLLLLIPVVCFAAVIGVERYLKDFPKPNDQGCWIPFVGGVLIFLLSFSALAYTYYPEVVPGQMTIWDAASATEALWFIFYGAVIVLPAILMYTFFAYRVFWGKTRELTYY